MNTQIILLPNEELDVLKELFKAKIQDIDASIKDIVSLNAKIQSNSLFYKVEGFANIRARFGLSPREYQIAQLLLDDIDVPTIAEMLGISQKTVSTIKYRLYDKVGCNSPLGLFKKCYSIRGSVK